ncbi:MAG TPA: type IV pilus assembly protein PilM [bacterium]|nr:type IV pilus assembly protein PilM [bacterium]HPS28859.1 type IV pilus assembly protein PilM [bacterium]
MFFSNKQLLGLDLGSYLIKAARIQKKRGKYYLKKFGFIPIPLNTVVDGSIMNTYEMNDAIKTLLARERLKEKYCSICIAGHGIINRTINVPKVGAEEFYNALKVEAETHIPHDIKEIYFDGLKTDIVEDGRDRVILIAARKDLVGDFIQVVSDAGVKPMSVEIDSTALANIFEVNYPEEKDNTIAILNIGASKINVVIISNGNVRFFRDVLTGGNYITEEITRRLKVSFQQAESLKSGSHNTGDSILPNQVEEVVADVAKNMVADVSRVFDYYTNTNPEDGVKKVFITGGTTRSHTFTQTLSSSLEIPVEKLNPFKEIIVSGQVLSREEVEDFSHIASVSLGLALRRIDEA